MKIRPATLNDIESIRKIADSTWNETYREIFSKEFIQKFLEQSYQADFIKRSMEDSSAITLVAEEREVFGFSQAAVRKFGFELMRIYILPECQRKGAGGAFLEETEKFGRFQQHKELWTQTHSQNFAQYFFQKHGFVEIPDQACNQDNLLLMKKTL